MLQFIKWDLLLFLSMALLLASGCRKEEAKAPAGGVVTATATYEKYFGPPPAVLEGEAFAVAGFLPVVGTPGKVRPIPLFMITKGRRPDLLISHLLALPEFSLPPGLVNPFPPGTRLESYSVQGDTAELTLSFPSNAANDMQGIVAAIGHSLAQFPEIRRVRVKAGGALLAGIPPEGVFPDPRDILEPEAPRPVAVVCSWEEGRPREVSVFFDRPVTVQEIRLATADGRPLAGDFYRSVFDMAVVIHPDDPAQIADGMPVTVDWRAADPLGRAGAGRDTFHLRHLEHP
jgi:hypothetical protein